MTTPSNETQEPSEAAKRGITTLGATAEGADVRSERSPDDDSITDHRVGPDLAVEPDIFAQLEDVARDAGCSLLHVGRKGNALQLFIDHPDGVTLDHCSSISRESSALLDALDYGRGRYILEVGSPGLDREFYRLSDYTQFVGSQVKVVHLLNGHKSTLRGELIAFDPETKRVQVQDSSNDTLHSLNLRDIQTTRLEIAL